MLSKTLLFVSSLLSIAPAIPLSFRASNQVFSLGTDNDPANIRDGIGAGRDSYTTYCGDGSAAAGWPTKALWISFEEMFNANKAIMRVACINLGPDNGPDNSEEEIGQIWNAIQAASYQSHVDHRFILAILMQESKGCVRVHTTNNGVTNNGLMQTHDGGFSCNNGGSLKAPCPNFEIFGMVFEGVAGTPNGDGLAGILDSVGGDDAKAYYQAARRYNSGSIGAGGDLELGGHSTNCYASDIANRLTGWVWADSTCHF